MARVFRAMGPDQGAGKHNGRVELIWWENGEEASFFKRIYDAYGQASGGKLWDDFGDVMHIIQVYTVIKNM